MQREPTAISLVEIATPNMPVRSQRPISENVVNSMPIMAASPWNRVSLQAYYRRTMTDTAEVVIVGAGIMGVSTAYHLARLGMRRVIVLERDTVCSGSTAFASGGIRHQYANRLGVELTTHSIVTYERFAEEFGVDPQFRQHGYL